MELRGVQTISRASVQQFAVTCEIFVVASVQRVMAALGFSVIPVAVIVAHGRRAKFQREQSVLTPGHRRVHVDLVLGSAQVREAFSPGRSKIHLKLGRLFLIKMRRKSSFEDVTTNV